MNLLNQYLRDFNREYWATQADRRRAGKNLLRGLATGLLIIALALATLLLADQ